MLIRKICKTIVSITASIGLLLAPTVALADGGSGSTGADGIASSQGGGAISAHWASGVWNTPWDIPAEAIVRQDQGVEAKWTDLGGKRWVMGNGAWGRAYREAKARCRRAGNCANPKIVLVGFWTIHQNGGWYIGGGTFPALNSHMSLDKRVTRDKTLESGTWKTTMGAYQKGLASGNPYDEGVALGNISGKPVVMVVIGMGDCTPEHKCDPNIPDIPDIPGGGGPGPGWRQNWAYDPRIDISSWNEIDSHHITGCAAYYYATATGIDGYVRGLSTKTTKYETPFGHLYDAIQTGGTWTDEHGRRYGPFKGDWTIDQQKLEEVKQARNQACDETWRMKINYNLGDHAAGESPSFVDSDFNVKTGGKHDVSIKIRADSGSYSSKSDFTKNFAKGGIYKVTKAQKVANLAGKTRRVKRFTRSHDWHEWLGWSSCNPKKESGCEHIGESMPPEPAGLQDDPIHPGGAHRGYYSGPSGWNQLGDAQSEQAVQTVASGSHKLFGRQLNAMVDKGYITMFDCNGILVNPNNIDQNLTLNNAKCNLVSNVSRDSAIDYAVNGPMGGYGVETFTNGVTSSSASDALNGQLHPVGNRYQSIVTIAYQDYVNLNCNKIDFDAFINSLRSQQAGIGIPGDKMIQTDVSTKYNGSAHTGTITLDDAHKLGWSGLREIVPRVLGNSVINSSTKIKGLDIKQVTGSDSPTVDGQPWEEYSSLDGNYWTAYNALKDPVYSKECPYDCTVQAGATSNEAQKLNINTKGNPNKPDLASGAIGVKAWASDAKGNIDPARFVNAANMVFFRNNEWNNMLVDLYTPTVGSSRAGDVSYDGKPAKSTVLMRDPNGTTWYAKDVHTILTHMQPLQGSYNSRDIFTGEYSEENLAPKRMPEQMSLNQVTTSVKGVALQLDGQINKFRIKSKWATEQGKPLKFQLKWEYDTTNHVLMPDNIDIQGLGKEYANRFTVNSKIVTTTVDGKCLGQHNTTTPYPDTMRLAHDSSGSGTVDTDESTFQKDGAYGISKRGYISVTFVRATAE